MRTSGRVALGVAGLALVGLGGRAAWTKVKRMPQMMQHCMRLCSGMLDQIRQTNAMAVFATPELRHVFAGWLEGLEGRAAAMIADGEKDAAALAAALDIDEESARYLLGRLAASGKATLVARPRA